jgi:isopenicillin N synthase-like dioxygenase
VEYIQLENLDLSKYDDPITRKELAKEFFTALTGTGFFTITNHGISKEEWDQQMDLAHAVMTLSPEEKKPYEGEQLTLNISNHCLNCN